MATHHLKLIGKHLEYDDVAILDFVSVDDKKIPFTPGQYMNLHVSMSSSDFGNSLSSRPYTIASAPSDTFLRFAIRKRGSFSSMLHELSNGTSVIADGPYGVLCPPLDSAPVICIAAGIGIAPFMSWIRSLAADKENSRPIFVLVSNTAEFRAPFLKELIALEKENVWLSVKSFLTKQSDSAEHPAMLRRIAIEDIKNVVLFAPDASIAICGLSGFVLSMQQAAQAANVPKARILTEAFY